MVRRLKGDTSYHPIGDYGIIGDCHTAALVSRNGSVDWYCPARFDAPAVFCRLLDAGKGGHFSISPASKCSVERHYQGKTNVLETTFAANESRISVIDFMPVHQRTASRRGYDVGSSRRILRLVAGLSGEMEVKVDFWPTFDYASGETALETEQSIAAMAHKDGRHISLACLGTQLEFVPGPSGRLRSHFTVRQGERHWLVLTEADDPDRVLELPSQEQCEQQLSRSRSYWEHWANKCSYHGPYRDMVLRSALILKLLTYEPTGAIIAAPTTSLPEEIGGSRNWDYRYAWVRDSALMLYALMNIGYREEAADFFEWLQETHHKDPSPDLQVLYTIDGNRELSEKTLRELEGYQHSQPVRVGNAAVGQLQLDIYGEVLTAAYLYFASGIGRRRDSSDWPSTGERQLEHDWPLLRGLVERAEERWKEPDNGIWEVRGELQPFLYSKLMCWEALDRGIRLAREYSLAASLSRWTNVEKAIRNAILTYGFNKEIGAFTQAFGSTALDASALLIPRAGFLPATDPRVQSTIGAIESRLTENRIVYRYRSGDNLPGGEGVFLTCSFWLVDALALSGRLDEAHDLFERVSGYANDLGLLSEELDPASNELLGNFPQGFTHMALINAATNLAKATKHGAEEHAETEAERAVRAEVAAREGYHR
jgi:GH15 family glucan-1,4-alpha-glucosidase